MTERQTALKAFLEELARRDGGTAVPEPAVRSAIRGYVKCMGIAYPGGSRELTPAQLERALRYYARRRAELRKQPMLLAA